jgi:hypothetical protein
VLLIALFLLFSLAQATNTSNTSSFSNTSLLVEPVYVSIDNFSEELLVNMSTAETDNSSFISNRTNGAYRALDTVDLLDLQPIVSSSSWITARTFNGLVQKSYLSLENPHLVPVTYELNSSDFVNESVTVYRDGLIVSDTVLYVQPQEVISLELEYTFDPALLLMSCTSPDELDNALVPIFQRSRRIHENAVLQHRCTVTINSSTQYVNDTFSIPELFADYIYLIDEDSFVTSGSPFSTMDYTLYFNGRSQHSSINLPVVQEFFSLSFLTFGSNTTSQKKLNTSIENESIEHEEIVLGKPVRWTKRVPTSESVVAVDLPPQANIIKTFEQKNNQRKEVPAKFVRDARSQAFGLQVVNDNQVKKIEVTTLDSDFIEVVYETPAPQKTIVENSTSRKKIIISSDMHYENVLSFIDIDPIKKGQAVITWNVNGTNTTKTLNNTLVDTDGDNLYDRVEWITPHLSDQLFTIDLVVLNVQSYPVVGGLWQTRINTTGIANLTIQGINGTAFGAEGDLLNYGLRCGATAQNYTTTSQGIFVENYSCTNTTFWEVSVLTGGVHNQEITFGNLVAYANNYARFEPDVIMLTDADGDPDATTDTAVTWDTQTRVDSSVYAHTPGQDTIQVLSNGLYRLNYILYVEMLGNNRHQLLVHAEVDGVDSGRCYGSGYMRDTSENQYSVFGACVLNLTAGQNVRLVSRRDSSVGSLTPTFTANKTRLFMQSVNATHLLRLRDTVGGDQFSTSGPDNITFDQIDSISSAYSYVANDSAITIHQNGTYKVDYGVGFTQSTSNRLSANAYVEINRSGTIFKSPYLWSHVNSRGNSNSRDAALAANGLINLQAGDQVSLVIARASVLDVGTSAQTVGGWTHLDMEYLGSSNEIDALQIQDTSDSLDLDTATEITQTFDTVDYAGESFTYVAGHDNISLLVPGLYHVSANIMNNRTVGGSRVTIISTLYVDGVPSCYGTTYNRGEQAPYNSFEGGVSFACLLDVQSSTNLSLTHVATTGTETISVSPDRSTLTIHSLSVEANPPEVTNITIGGVPLINRNLTISADIIDAHTITYVQAEISGPYGSTTVPLSAQGDTYSASTNFTREVGTYTVTINASDDIGNVNASESRTYNITFADLEVTTPRTDYLRNEQVDIIVYGYNYSQDVEVIILDESLDPVTAAQNYTTDSFGSFNFTYTVPSDAELFSYIIATDDVFGRAVNGTYTVVSAIILLNNTNYSYQDTVSVLGSNWDISENVTLEIVNDTTTIFGPVNFTTNSTGGFEAGYTLNFTLQNGAYTVVATQPSNVNKFNNNSFYLDARKTAVTTNFTSYSLNENITVSVFNFTPNTVVQFQLLNTSLALLLQQNYSVDINGDTSFNFTVTEYDNYTIQITDLNFSQFRESQQIEVALPSIQFSQSVYDINDQVLLSGSNWRRSQNVSIDILNSSGSTIDNLEAAVDLDGSFSVNFAAPSSSLAGIQLYEANVTQGVNQANRSFGVATSPRVNLDRTGLYANETLTISGSFYDPLSTVVVDIDNGLVSDINFPQTVSADGTGSFSLTYNVSNYCEAEYTVTAYDQNFPSLINDSTSFAIVHDDIYVQRGYALISEGQTQVQLTAGQDYGAPRNMSRTFVRIVGTRLAGVGDDDGGNTQGPAYFMATVANGDDITTNITFERSQSSSGLNTRVYYEIIEYLGPEGGPNAFVVQDYDSVTASGVNQTNGTVLSGSITDTDVVVLITGQRSASTASPDTHYGLFTSEWNSFSNVPTFTRATTEGSGVVSYAVIEFTGSNWNVDRTEHVYVASGPTETEIIAAVNTSSTFIFPQMRSSIGSLDEQGQVVWLSSSTEMSFQLQSGAGIFNQTAAVWIVENTGGLQVDRYDGNRINTGPEPEEWTEDISLVDFYSASITGETAWSTGSGTATPRGSIGFILANASQVDLWRSDTGQNQDYRYEVVQWPTDQTITCIEYDSINPDLNQSLPINNSQSEIFFPIAVQANASDVYGGVDTVLVEIMYPNTTVQNFTMLNVSSTNFTYTLASADQPGQYRFTIYVNDTWKNMNSSVRYVTVTDTTNPLWSDNTSSPINPVYNFRTYDFTINWSDNVALDTVLFEHNFSGSPINVTAINFSFDNLSAGNYYWRSYANDTSGNANQSDVFSYSVNKASPDINLSVGGVQSNYTSEFGESVFIQANLSALNSLPVHLYLDGIQLNASNDVVTSIENLPVGSYVFEANSSSSQNYTAASTSWNLSVVDTSAPLLSNLVTTNVLLSQSVPLEVNVSDLSNYDVNFTIILPNGTSQVLIPINVSTLFSANFTQTVAVGNYTVIANATDTYGNTAQLNDSFTVDYASLSIATNREDYVTDTLVVIETTGFGSSNLIQVEISNSSGFVSGYPVNETSEVDGSLNTSWLIPSNQDLGTYTINLTDTQNTSRSVQKTVEIIPAVITINQSLIEQGSIIEISGLGWNAGENVTVFLNDTLIGNFTANGSFEFETTYFIDFNLATGFYEFIALESLNPNKNDTAPVTIFARNTSLTIAHPWYRYDELIQTTFSNFEENALIEVSFNDTWIGFPQNISTDANGDSTINISVVGADGTYALSGESTNYSNLKEQVNFSVVSSTLALNATLVQAPEDIAISGSYYSRNQNVTLNISNSSSTVALVNLTVDSLGNISYVWSPPLPSQALAEYTLTVTDGIYSASAFANVTREFNVTTLKTNYSQLNFITIDLAGFNPSSLTLVNITSQKTGASINGFPKTLLTQADGSLSLNAFTANYCADNYTIQATDVVSSQVSSSTVISTILRDFTTTEVAAGQVSFTGSRTDAVGGILDLTSDDDSVVYFGQTNAGTADGHIVVEYNISSIPGTEDDLERFTLQTSYCYSGDQTSPVCDQGDAQEGTLNGQQNLELYNYRTGQWVNYGSLTETSDALQTSTFVKSTELNDFVEQDIIQVRYAVDLTVSGTDDGYLVIDSANLNVTYGQSGSFTCGAVGTLNFISDTDVSTEYIYVDNLTYNATIVGANSSKEVYLFNRNAQEYAGILAVNLTSNVNLSVFSSAINRNTSTSVIYNSTSVAGVINKSLLIPRNLDSDNVYICPHASTIAQVNDSCTDVAYFDVGDNYNGLPISRTTIDGFSYYLVQNVTGTGGGEASPELFVENISYTQDLVEGEVANFSLTIRNSGQGQALNYTVRLNISKVNGTQSQVGSIVSLAINTSSQSTSTVNLLWTVLAGDYNLTFYVDDTNKINELNETNNTFQLWYNTSIWQEYYGEIESYTYGLEDLNNNAFRDWDISNFTGHLLLADADSTYLISDLVALNYSQLILADSALSISNYSESLITTYDADNNQVLDQVITFNLSGTVITDVPVVTSIASDNFTTGILYDSADGVYSGSEDIVFITQIKNNNFGSYGIADYEVRIPTALDTYVGGVNAITIYQQFEEVN